MTCFVLPPLPTSTPAQLHQPPGRNPRLLLQIHAAHLCCVHLWPQHQPCLHYALQEWCCHDYHLHQNFPHPCSRQIQAHPQRHRQRMLKNGWSVHQIQQNEHSPCPSPQTPRQCRQTCHCHIQGTLYHRAGHGRQELPPTTVGIIGHGIMVGNVAR